MADAATKKLIKEKFKLADGSGTISKDELQNVLKTLGMEGKDMDSVFKNLDLSKGSISIDAFIDWTYGGKPAPGDAASKVKEDYAKFLDSGVVSNSIPMHPPTEPTLLDNMLFFMPEKAVKDLKIEPNMDDKGDGKKELWFGRVWEIRAMFAYQYQYKIDREKKLDSIPPERQKLLNDVLGNPIKRALLARIAGHWKGAVFRNRCKLANVLDRLRFSNLRGTLVYAHGSGGCSWDNFRICRMIAGMGFLVIAPDGFAYPKNTAMGQLRHKDILPLKQAGDDTNYWTGDLMYASGGTGTATYSTKADSVLEDPDGYRELYEKAYQLRRSELHFTIKTLPLWIKTKGFFLGGTSEGAMTVARFDDQRYGDMVMGRFINSFSVEYCYFTPTPADGEIGGQLKVPTLNIIGTKDQYFGAEDSVAKIVAEDEETGYGSKNLTGHGYNTFWRQGMNDACVCLLENGVHSPCKTHDNFLRSLFDCFFSRPHDIWELDKIWSIDPTMAELVELKQTTRDDPTPTNVTQVFVPKMKFPQKMSLREVQAMRMISHYEDKIKAEMEADDKEQKAQQAEAKAMLDGIRKGCKKAGGKGFSHKEAKDMSHTYYSKGDQAVTKTKKELAGKSTKVSTEPKKK